MKESEFQRELALLRTSNPSPPWAGQSVPVIARNTAAVVTFALGAVAVRVPNRATGFVPYGHGLNGLWKRKSIEKQLLIVDATNGTASVVQKGRMEPDLQLATSLISDAFGVSVEATRAVVVPLRLRVPVVGTLPGLPLAAMRSRPVPHLPPVVFDNGTLPIEVRLVVSRRESAAAPKLWVDVLVGGAYATSDGRPRSFVYLADHRRLREAGPADVAELLAGAMRAAYWLLEWLWGTYQLQVGAPSQAVDFLVVETPACDLLTSGIAELCDSMWDSRDPLDPYLEECERELRAQNAGHDGQRAVGNSIKRLSGQRLRGLR